MNNPRGGAMNTHIAVGSMPGAHYRRSATGVWLLCRAGEPPIVVTVDETIRALETLAAIGEQP